MKIQGADGMSPENIRDEVNRGGRLVIYTYCISILVMTFKRPTDIRLVKAGHNAAAAGWPCTVLSLLLGWWGFPWGPIYTIECLYRNLCGGIDVTDDVLRQLQPVAAAAQTPTAMPPPLVATPAIPARRFDLRVAGLMAGAVCLIVALGLSVYCYQQSQSLTVVLASGLDRPYRVLLNGEPRTLPPLSSETLELPEGEFVLADVPGGHVVGAEQRFTFTLPFFDHLHSARVAIINPDRLAVFVQSEVPYYKDGTVPPKDETPVFSLLANQAGYLVPKPDHVLTEPEARIDMPSGTTRVVKTRLQHAKEADLGWLVRTLAEKSGQPAARDYVLELARHRSDEDFLRAALPILQPADLRPFFQRHLADRPVNVEWHRYYQHAMEAAHPTHDLAAEYRGYAATEPDNGALLYLLGRQTADLAEQGRLWQAALAARPPCPYAHGALGFEALSEGRFTEARAHYDAAFRAGVTSGGINHYRRQAYVAQGRTAELLPELADARKQAPLDLTLVEEEMRVAFATDHDLAAANRLKAAYLAALKATEPSASDLADADAYLQSVVAYLGGDLPAYAKSVARFESPVYRFRAAVSTGKLDEATRAHQAGDAYGEFLLYLLAHRAGQAADAEQHFQAARAALKQGDHDSREIAAALDAATPDARTLCAVHVNIENKRILLAALGVRQPQDRAAYFDLARKLNYSLDFPHQFLRTVLQD